MVESARQRGTPKSPEKGKVGERGVIRLRGVRQNNLKNLDLDIPLGRMTVVTGLSGSGKSSLAFDTLFAEGQRRYIETFSPYARQFFDRMDKPQADSIEGIPPAIAIEQRNAVRTTRSTVGTMTEVCDYMKVLWTHIAELHCRKCGSPVAPEPPGVIWKRLRSAIPGEEVTVVFSLPMAGGMDLKECLSLIGKQGYRRLWVDGAALRIEDAEAHQGLRYARTLEVVQDRLRLSDEHRARFCEACEQAYRFGKGRLRIVGATPSLSWSFSEGNHCATCDLEYKRPSPALFSFNHPSGACPSCKGFGRIIAIDYALAVPDTSRTLAQGVVKPWLTGMSAECQDDMMKFCRRLKVPVDVPFRDLAPEWQRWVIDGEPGYGSDGEHQWPKAWYGVKGYFRWLESKTYKMHVRVLLSRYRSYAACPDCGGRRLQPESLLYRAAVPAGTSASRRFKEALTLADFYALSLDDTLELVRAWQNTTLGRQTGIKTAMGEVQARLGYLVEAGLGYLTLDRTTRTLSGGETERVNLATCLGARLVNTLFVLDEPSVGLHPRDTGRLVGILHRLRSAGNTVVVVEHEGGVIRAADHALELGPGQGERGGQLVFQGSLPEMLRCENSLTGQYLSGRKHVDGGRDRDVDIQDAWDLAVPGWLRLTGASCHNLRGLDVALPLQKLVCVTGVSGSGKTTLIRDVLLPALRERLAGASKPLGAADSDEQAGAEGTEGQTEGDSEAASAGSGSGSRLKSLTGADALDDVLLVDQSPIGRTPRSNAAVYVGAFDSIRDVFAASEEARRLSLASNSFSFNSAEGQCERCRGAGFEKIEMQFLSDIFVRCPACDGRRYRPHILKVLVSPPPAAGELAPAPAKADASDGAKRSRRDVGPEVSPVRAMSIADLLESTVEEAIAFLNLFPGTPARRAVAALGLLREVGLGYLRLGQPLTTLSGGESQRLKLVSHLAATMGDGSEPGSTRKVGGSKNPKTKAKEKEKANEKAKSEQPAPRKPRTLFLFDEPTTGLHFDDVRVLLLVFQRLVDAGHSVVVIEHNLELVQCADWIVDLGPEAGEGGGRMVISGTPSDVASCRDSHTGVALRQLGALQPARRRR